MLCDNLEGGIGWDVQGRFKMEGTYVYLWLIRVVIQQKPTQYCKAIIFQLKINKFLKVLFLSCNTKLAFMYNLE